MNVRIVTMAIILSTFNQVIHADEIFTGVKASDCASLMSSDKSDKSRKLSDGEIATALIALESAGYKITLKLFQRRNPDLDAIVSRAIGGGADMNTLYFSFPTRVSPVEVRRRLLGPPPDDTTATRKAPLVNRPVKIKKEKEVPLPEEQMLEQKKWLARTLISILQRKKKLNFVVIARETDAEAIIQTVKSAYGGSLYDAVRDNGIDPMVTLSVPADQGFTTDKMRKSVHLVSQRFLPSSTTANDLATAISMEFTLEDIELAHAMMVSLFTVPPTEPLEELAKYSGEIVHRTVETEEVEKFLSALARNQTLQTYFRMF